MITDEGSVPEMRIWPISSIESDKKWRIHLKRSLFMYFYYFEIDIGKIYKIMHSNGPANIQECA